MTTQRAFQSDYRYYVGRNYFGTVARPGEATTVDLGIAGEDLIPGEAVVVDPQVSPRVFRRPYDETIPAWAQGTTYAVGDKVSHAGSNYIAIRAHTAAAGDVADGAPNQANATAWAAYTSPYLVRDVVGIVLYNEGTVPNENSEVIIKSGEPVRVGRMGSFYAKAGTALEVGDQVVWNIANKDWDRLATEPTTYAAAHRSPAFCAERSVDDTSIFVLRLYGQIR